MFLEPKLVETLTGRKTTHAQVRQLEKMGISHLVNARNEVLISVNEVERVLGGKANNNTYSIKRFSIRRKD